MDEAHLRELIAKHVLWLESRGRDGVRADLTQVDLSRADLRGTDLSFANLGEADLSRAQLCLANLGRADLSGANLQMANLSGAQLGSANLHLANLGRADLSEADLSAANLLLAGCSEANLRGARLRGAHLSRADLRGANLSRADRSEADLPLANLSEANLRGANLSRAHLSEADLSGAEISGAELRGATLRGANLQRARLVGTNLAGADLSGARVHGASVSGTVSDCGTQWHDLVITPTHEPPVTTDDIEIAQLVHLLLGNLKTRHILEAVASRLVLILGRFGQEQKPALEVLKDALRQRRPALVPVVFDVLPPAQGSGGETVSLIARVARFVIADLTDAKLVVQELRRLARAGRTPIQPIVCAAAGNLSLALADLDCIDTVLPVFTYRDAGHLRRAFDAAVARPAEEAAGRLPPPV